MSVTVLGIIALIGGLLMILRSLLSPARLAYASRSDGREPYRFDVRLGVVLLMAAVILATPHLFGLEYERVTLTIVGFFFLVFVSAYSRYAKQMRAPQPRRYREHSLRPGLSRRSLPAIVRRDVAGASMFLGVGVAFDLCRKTSG